MTAVHNTLARYLVGLGDAELRMILPKIAALGLDLDLDQPKIRSWCEEGAAHGDVLATFVRAKFLSIGFLGPVDRASAITILEGKTLADYLPAAYLLACLYSESAPNNLDGIEKSISLMHSVAEEKYPSALRSLAFLLMDEKGVDPVSDRLVRQAAELDDPVALHWIAIRALGESDKSGADDAIELLLRAAGQEYAAACSMLADIYEHGRYGVQADALKAKRFGAKASELEPHSGEWRE